MKLSELLMVSIEESPSSINALALMSGVSQPSLQRFVSGERGLSMEVIDKLVDYFGLIEIKELDFK